jgi:class 3 adenylate cyclase
MKCPSCQSVQEETQKFCRTCGARLQTACPSCGSTILPSDRFCGECGCELEIRKKAAKKSQKIVSERKLVTSLFADISGYTAISERLDLEEVKDLVSRIFGEIAQIVIKYEGHIEKFAGDEVMALFGVPGAHEDDPVRAVKAASEIHQVIHRISKKETIGQPLAVHIGINTGFAITGQLDFEKATASHIAGDALNVASRLCNLAKPGETLVGQDTYELAEGFFNFEPQPPVEVKGKTIPIKAYRVLSARELPSGRRSHISGRRATLIGRKEEMAVLAQQMARVQDGEAYSAVAICGEAGTGKTRLIEEFKATLDLRKVTWMEGHAYAYTRNISYYPLINLIKRDLEIEEEDTPGQMAAKLEARLQGLGDLQGVAPYFGGLLSLPYPAVAEMSPEFRRSRLHQAVPVILKAQASKGPVVICFEDLHWADHMFLDFLRGAVLEKVPGVILLYTFRPPLELFSKGEVSMMGESYQEIKLYDLSAAEIQEMLASILGTADVPQELRRFVQEKIGTNPFYLQEMINSLIESGILQPENGDWRLTGAIDESAIPSSIHAVIAGRVDRLEETVKYLLQEASVIGKTFPYEILKRITRYADNLDSNLEQLKDLALFRRSSPWEQEYEFKHALIQEVVYSGLLKKDRQAMHQQIGLAMEQVFADRLPEFYETLAFHFRHSDLSQRDLSLKAVHYLRESGRKSLQKYAVQESHEYYQRALHILKQTLGASEEEKRLLIEFLNEWAPVFYYRADFAGLRGLFLEHQALAESLSDKALVGSFYVWLCVSLFNFAGRMKESYELNLKALEMFQNEDNTAIGMGYANIIWCCAEMKLVAEGIHYGEEVLARRASLDPMGYVLSLGGLGMIYIFTGNSQKNFDLGRKLVEFGESHSDLRSTVVGYICTSYGHYSAGDFAKAVEWSQKAVELTHDPIFSVWPKLVLANFFIQSGKFQEADEILREIIPFCRHLGMYYIVEWAQSLYGAALMAGGQYSRGMKMITEAARAFTENGRFISLYFLEFALAEIYFQMATQRPRLGFWTFIKNLGFILKEVPFARHKAETYLRRIIKVGQEIGATGFMQNHAAHNLEILQHLGEKNEKKEAVRPL